ncbi:MAG: DUF4401 domain-containing protein [Desulfuromonadales bacterium]|nr:DUF4401 domain-containing protein [Desulfuromonadales bacterium]
MNETSPRGLWQTLRDHSLVSGDLPPSASSPSPWYVRVMLGVAGWIGAFFLFGFVSAGLSFVLVSASAALIGGLLVSAGAGALFRVERDNDFIDQAALALSLLGQLLLIFACYETFSNDAFLLYGSIFVVELLATLAMPHFIYRVLTSAGASIALTLAMHSVGLHGLADALSAACFTLLWLQETAWVRLYSLWRPCGYGLALALFCSPASRLWGLDTLMVQRTGDLHGFMAVAPSLGNALLFAVFFGTALILLRRLRIAVTSRTGCVALASAILLAGVALFVPGLTQALLIVIIGHAACNRLLVGIGLAALAGFIGGYYYTLQTTLLIKAAWLFASGALLIVARPLARAVLPTAVTREEPADA